MEALPRPCRRNAIRPFVSGASYHPAPLLARNGEMRIRLGTWLRRNKAEEHSKKKGERGSQCFLVGTGLPDE